MNPTPKTDGPERVTVVIPTKNRRRLLLRTLSSVLAQVDVEVEVVVVDDGGDDGTVPAVRALGIPGVRTIRHAESRGVSAARNAGLATVSTPWVAFVDDDDLWTPDKLSSQLDALRAHPSARWSCVGAVHVNAVLQPGWVQLPLDSDDVLPVMRERMVVPGGGSGVLVETALAREVGGFDEGLSIVADWDFYLRLADSSLVAPVPRPLVAYFVHQDSMYHDPRGLIREIRSLAAKYDGSDGGLVFHFRAWFWYREVVMMARRLGDRRAQAALLAQSLLVSGPLPPLRVVGRKVGALVRRSLGEKPAPVADDPVPVLEESVRQWLDRLRREGPPVSGA
jgi:glycosyltransferase involved in cell wall biosynthesis